MPVDDVTSFRTSPDAYDRHVGRYGSALANALIERACIAREQRVLDVGCGPGALTVELARVVGGRLVAAVDPSEPYVEACRARAVDADVRMGSGEALPFDDNTFDAVLSQLVVNFLSDAGAGVREMQRVARPGGAVAACVWDYAGEMTLLRAFWDAAIEVEPDQAAGLDEGTRMRYCSPGELASLWTDAGLESVDVNELVVSATYTDFDDLWGPFAAGVAPSGAYCASLDEGPREQLRSVFHRRLGSPSGPFALTARAWAVVGRA